MIETTVDDPIETKRVSFQLKPKWSESTAISVSFKYAPEQGLWYAGNGQLTITVRNRRAYWKANHDFRRLQFRRFVRKHTVGQAERLTNNDPNMNTYATSTP